MTPEGRVPLRIITRPQMGDRAGCLRLALPQYGWELQPGDMWREPGLDTSGREAWGVVLPNYLVWYTTDVAGGGMWDVTGKPPAITVTPSLNAEDDTPWHGWIRDGYLMPA